jgi:hypothetical protein
VNTPDDLAHEISIDGLATVGDLASIRLGPLEAIRPGRS